MEYAKQILTNFNIPGKFIEAKPFGSGHINDTLLVRFEDEGKYQQYILRRINDYVFKEPQEIIENTLNVTNHIREKLVKANEEDIKRKVLTLIKAKDGKYYCLDGTNYWCLINFIDGAYTVDRVDSIEQAYEAAKAYGRFEKYLSDFDTGKCHITIKNFHNLANRIIVFDEIVKEDPRNRAQNIPNVVEQARSYNYLCAAYKEIEDKNLPLRITHNDTKINNIMLHSKTNEGLCVVDIDTVMPGIILNDFGDMVRTFTSPALEDEKEFSKVNMRLSIFDSLVKGYLSELNDCITEDEVKNLVLGAKIIVYEQAIRFLTDFIAGDVYYKVEYDLHNLNRAINQFTLLASIEDQSNEMEKIVEKYYKRKTELNSFII